MTIFLFNISHTTKQELSTLILSLVRGNVTRLSFSDGQRFAFIDMHSKAEEKGAIETLNNYSFKGNTLGCDWAKQSLQDSRKKKVIDHQKHVMKIHKPLEKFEIVSETDSQIILSSASHPVRSSHRDVPTSSLLQAILSSLKYLRYHEQAAIMRQIEFMEYPSYESRFMSYPMPQYGASEHDPRFPASSSFDLSHEYTSVSPPTLLERESYQFSQEYFLPPSSRTSEAELFDIPVRFDELAWKVR
ncbi:hypothetical protein ADUPG1_009622 [Aduncisulcus paluster]|uniref:RRM domain-containing protein n=1 Tax=Aduncisulcus paluster TaxID=2918883 RepID=A0ABQ5KXF9_9EUKA|nr:hypothetical protein ADUPG1_009622 [Aduncisulcus paluster]